MDKCIENIWKSGFILSMGVDYKASQRVTNYIYEVFTTSFRTAAMEISFSVFHEAAGRLSHTAHLRNSPVHSWSVQTLNWLCTAVSTAWLEYLATLPIFFQNTEENAALFNLDSKVIVSQTHLWSRCTEKNLYSQGTILCMICWS